VADVDQVAVVELRRPTAPMRGQTQKFQ
jgi:hypothetical protein